MVRRAEKVVRLRSIVASRTVICAESGAPVTIDIGRPVPHGNDWRCAVRIRGSGSADGTRYVYGVDSLQALMLALYGPRYFLERSGGTFLWLGAPYELGFPRFINGYDAEMQ